MNTQKIERIYPQDEMTRDPIYIFQRACKHYDLDDGCGYEWCPDCQGVYLEGHGETIHEGGAQEDTPEYEEYDTLIDEEALSDINAISKEWHSELVFFTREEGEKYGKSRDYNYPDGWRVYCVSAQGILAELLKMFTKREGEDNG